MNIGSVLAMSSQELSPVFPLREEPFALEPEPSPQDDVNLFESIVAYVEVRSQAENRSRAIAQELRDLGVTVSDRLGPNITHIVYRQGCRRTAQWAERHDVPLVSVSWIQACKAARKLLPTARFPAETVDGFSPGQHARRRMRSMQPKSFEEDLKLSSERKRRAARRNQRRNELRRRVVEAEQRLWSCENDGADSGAKPDNYFADPHIYVAKTPPSMKEFVERRGRRYSIASADSISPVCSPPKQLSLDSAAESTSNTPSQKPRPGLGNPPETPLSMRSPRRKLSLTRTDASIEETPSSFSSTVSQRSPLCPARKLFDASSFSGILIEPKMSSNRLQSMCNVFPKAFQKRKILGADAANAQRKRNRHSEQPLTKASFLFDDSGEESETDAKVDQEAVMMSRTKEHDPTSEPAARTFQEPQAEVTLSPTTPTTPTATPTTAAAAVSPSSAASVSEADICELVRDCSRRGRRSRVSFKRADSTSSSNWRDSSVTALQESPACSPKKRNSAGRNSSSKKSNSLINEQPSVKQTNSAADSSESSMKSRRSIPSVRRSFSSKNSSKASIRELSMTENNASMDSVSESSSKNNNSAMTSVSGRMLDLMKRPFSTRRPTRASFAAFNSSGSSSSSPLVAPAVKSRRVSARLQAAAARTDEELSEVSQPPPRAAVGRRSNACPTVPRASGTLSTTPPAPPGWSCETVEDHPSQEKAYGVLAPPSSPARRSKRVSAALVLESLICHDSPSSTISTASSSRRARPSLDDFRTASTSATSSSSSLRRKREAPPPKPKNMRPKRNIVLTSLHKKQQNTISSAIRVLGGAYLREKVEKNKTTHVVTTWPLRRTLNLLRARLLGLPVVRIDWLLESREAGHWLPEEKYLIQEVSDTESSPSIQKIFEECGRIFVSPHVSPPQRELLDIIKLAGGEDVVTGTPENARIQIVSDSKSSRDSSPSVNPKWVLDSIMACKALPLKDYLSQE